MFEKFNKTAGYGSPCHGDRILRDLNSSSYIGDKLIGSLDAPEGSGTPWSPSCRYAFCTAHAHRYTIFCSPSS